MCSDAEPTWLLSVPRTHEQRPWLVLTAGCSIPRAQRLRSSCVPQLRGKPGGPSEARVASAVAPRSRQALSDRAGPRAVGPVVDTCPVQKISMNMCCISMRRLIGNAS